MNNHFDFSDLPRIALEALLILALGITIGLTIHHRLIIDVLEGRVVTTRTVEAPTALVPEALPQPIDLQSLQVSLNNGAVLLDARIVELWNEGRIAGARSFPLEEADDRMRALQAELPPDRELIAYCNGYGCPDSFDLAVKLLAAGFRRVRVFEGGFPEWRDAGLPVEEGE